jgi:hypothetical protein
MRRCFLTSGFGLFVLSSAALGCSGTIEPGMEPQLAGKDPARSGESATGEDAPAKGMMGPKAVDADDEGMAIDPGAEPALDCTAAAVEPGPAPLRLLTREQYLNTVADLVGEVPGLQETLGAASTASAFGLLQPHVSQVQLEGFQSAAELIAARVSGDAGRLAEVAPCADTGASAGSGEACARSLIERFGARAYRAPLTDADDVERHLGLFRAGAASGYAHGIELVLRGMLQAPRFLYHVELGSGEAVGEDAVKLSGHELAARLSYLVWNSAPDPILIDAVNAGALATPDDVEAQLNRLLADPRGSGLVRRFLSEWLHVDEAVRAVKDADLYPEWEGPELRAAVRDQAGAFFDHVLGAERGSLRALLTSRTVFTNGALADFYTGAPRGSGDAFEPLERAAGQASGVLTLPAVLALTAKPDESSPIYRGKLVREALLCQQLPAPPANIPAPPEVSADVSTRERLSQHEEDPACSGCHRLLDPIGFGFEHFDAIGRFRSEDGGQPVDASGELLSTADSDGAFTGVSELGEKLASSAEVEACMVKQWFRYALGRFEQDFDACTLQRLVAAFRAADQDLNALPRAVVASDAFLYRSRPLIEGAQP